MEPYAEVQAQYLEFARHAEEDSPCFDEWGRGVAGDDEVLAWIQELPGLKRQPNIVFAAARWHGVPAPGPYAGLRDALLADDGTIRATIMERSTQTNEVGRLATLLPAFAQAAPSGPVAPITTFETEEEAVERANDTEYGLASYVFTRDLTRTIRVAEGLDYGMVGVNTGLVSNAAAPFGGVKASGFGREGGFEGIEEYLDTTYVALAVD